MGNCRVLYREFARYGTKGQLPSLDAKSNN
ncbi:hypothetical protein R69888_05971 [Paraburkholderia haematera]|uniref:Uncharacterized protein n=1 Tax=Paraburkholderia haematera TaxID=2793077 RepID=A0ABM8SLB0_9BURK|nr:hypothetical protein R69888_05971 [Paraburkholderia haematera]